MTNHPRRAHDDEEPSAAATGDLAAEVPAVAEMAGEMAAAPPPPPVPAGFSPNGHPTPAAQALQALTTTLERLPQMLFQAVAQALSSVQVTVKQPPCGTCYVTRAAWFAQHAAELAQVEAAYRAAVETLPKATPGAG